jgi:hypothetical protein
MEIDKKCDGHTVFIKCSKLLSSNDIVSKFRIFLDNYIDRSGDKIECEYYVNIITNKEDISFGLAFVYITNSEVYYMLFGKNKDGSERCEYIDDPKWIDPPRIRSNSNSTSTSLKLLAEKKNSLDNSNSLLKVDWSVIMEADEEYERKEVSIKNKHVCPKIKVLLEPLMIPVIDGSSIYSEEFHIEPALPSEVQNTCHNHIIKATNIPNNINIDDLNDKFKPLISDVTSTYKRKYKAKVTEHEYPYIIITNDRTAFVIFDENTNDAKFAIHMAKKTIVKETKLWFVFSQKKDVIDDSDPYNNRSSYNNNRSPSNNNNRSPSNNNNNNNRSPSNNNNNNNRSPSNNNNNNNRSYSNRSPSNNNNNNRSPSNNNNNNRSPSNNNNNRSTIINDQNNDKDDNIADTDGFRYVKYNRK